MKEVCMNSFDSRIEHYEKVKKEKEQGIYHYIPFSKSFPRLSKHLPGIIPGIGYQIMANSGIGKSKFFRYLFIQAPYEFVKDNPDSGVSFHVIVNALEETVEELQDSFVINRLQLKYNHRLTINDLNGFSDKPLTDEVLFDIKRERDYFADLGKHLTIVNAGNPFGFYKYVRGYAQEHGKFYTRNGEEVACYDKEGNNLRAKAEENWSSYKPDNPRHIVICASDHIWLYGKESKMSKYETVANFSSYYSRQIMNNKFGFTTVAIQQLESGKEKKEYTFKGQSITDKLEPSLDAAGDIKILQRDNLVVLGLFSPYRYRIPKYRGYEIKKFKDTIRFLFVLKNRRGREGLVNPMFFNGAAETFEELPLPEYDDTTGEYVKSEELIQFEQKARELQNG